MINYAAVAGRKNSGSELKRVGIGGAVGRNVVRGHKRRQGDIARHAENTVGGLRRLDGNIVGGGQRSGRYRSEIFPDVLLGVAHGKPAGNHNGRIVGHVVGVVKIADRIRRRVADIIHGADRQGGIRAHRKSVFVKRGNNGSVGRVFIPPPALVLHHRSFVVERALVDVQVAHSVSFKPQRNGEV